MRPRSAPPHLPTRDHRHAAAAAACSALLSCALAISCTKPGAGPAPQSSSAADDQPNEPAGPTEPPLAASPPAAERQLAQPPEPWDPNQPIDLDTIERRRMYVTAETSAICPTRAQAEARSCGHSVEFPERGLRLRRGDAVYVVGDSPFDGHWRAIRYQVSGPLPAWIVADDVAATPLLPALETFAQRSDRHTAVDASAMTAEAIHRLPHGTLVRFDRQRGVALGAFGRVNDLDTEGGTILYVPVKRGVVAVQLVENPPDYAMRHSCLENGDCLQLDYVCERDGYCDEISILARTSGGVRVAPPSDPEGEWPAKWKQHMPLLQGIMVADRFGLWEFQTPSWAR